MSITGGGKVAAYFVTGTMNTDNGILKVDERNNFNSNIKLNSYSIRSNVDVNVTSSTKMSVNLYGNFDDYNGPIDGGTGVYKKIINTNPVLFLPFYEADESHKYARHILFGNSGSKLFLNPYADMVSGYKDSSRSLMLAQFELKQDLSALLLQGLRARIMASTQRRSYFDVQRSYNPFYYSLANFDKQTNEYSLSALNELTGTETLDYSEGTKEISTSSYMETAVNYDNTFGEKHTVSGLLVGILRNSIAANAGSLQASLPFRNIGLSGRFSYGFDSRYTAEVNFGYNGTERFYKDKRFGFFPSAGVAWNIANEKFWSDDLKEFIPSLKIRATYGLIGNDAIGDNTDRFFYLSEVNLNATALGSRFGQNFDYTRPGVSIGRYDNREITWETAKRLNLGIDLKIKDFTINADYSTDKRENILMNRAFIPTTMGLSAGVRANVGKAQSEAFETSLNYSKSFQNSMFLSLTGNFTYATNKYLKVEEPDYFESYRTLIGHPTNQQWGYIAERLFVDQQDINNSPVQTFGRYMPGDIKYRDLNEDGKITLSRPCGTWISYFSRDRIWVWILGRV
ncbi:SusC/RagA family TonB-linked outer membrane protein [Pedobacter panaciterrae]